MHLRQAIIQPTTTSHYSITSYHFIALYNIHHNIYYAHYLMEVRLTRLHATIHPSIHPSIHIHLDTWRLCKTKTVEIHAYHSRQFFFYLHLHSFHASIIVHPFVLHYGVLIEIHIYVHTCKITHSLSLSFLVYKIVTWHNLITLHKLSNSYMFYRYEIV